MVIAAKIYPAQVPAMPTKPENLLPHAMLYEMRPERIGYRLKLLRLALDMSPSEISDALGIERTYWSRFEGGKRPITEPIAALLVDRFGVTLDFVILGRWDRLPFDLAQKMRAADGPKNK